MTNRLQYPDFWAENGTATDPDLDTTHPSFEANRYETLGWHSEKPPEHWQNFLTQITDEKVIGFITDGIPTKDVSITYPDGAIYQDAGVYYVMQSGVAKELLNVNKAVYTNLLAAMNSLIIDHLAADNPHQDTVNTLVDGSYTKTAVDAMFGSPTDPGTIIYHKALVERAHNETPAQLGTLPTSGGTFTGQVGFLASAIMAGTPTKSVMLSPTTALVQLSCGGISLGVDAAGNAWVVTSSEQRKVLKESKYSQFQINSGSTFALPVPLVQMNIASTINDSDSVGTWTITTSTTPVFGSGGFDTSNSATLTGVSSTAACTLVVRGIVSSTPTVAVVDLFSASFATIADVITASGLSFTSIKQIWIYPRLSSYQKSMLVNK